MTGMRQFPIRWRDSILSAEHVAAQRFETDSGDHSLSGYYLTYLLEIVCEKYFSNPYRENHKLLEEWVMGSMYIVVDNRGPGIKNENRCIIINPK